MTTENGRRGEWLWPLAVFVAAFAVHVAWNCFFPDTPQSRWVDLEGSSPLVMAWQEYWTSGNYFLGLAYALPLAFALFAYRSYRHVRACHAAGVTVGGITFSGVLAAAGCFLAGCCGSPMLAVYLALLGPRFLPFAKPLVFAFSFSSVTIGVLYLKRQERAKTCENC